MCFSDGFLMFFQLFQIAEFNYIECAFGQWGWSLFYFESFPEFFRLFFISSRFLLRPYDVTTTSYLLFIHSFMQFQLNCVRDVILLHMIFLLYMTYLTVKVTYVALKMTYITLIEIVWEQLLWTILSFKQVETSDSLWSSVFLFIRYLSLYVYKAIADIFWRSSSCFS